MEKDSSQEGEMFTAYLVGKNVKVGPPPKGGYRNVSLYLLKIRYNRLTHKNINSEDGN